jgi:CTD small phosphatase-like protein 2
MLPPLTKVLRATAPVLPRKTRSSPPITLVLDLDETLVHCSILPMENADLEFKVQSNDLLYNVIAIV